jgi:hypothetical protein
VVFIEDELYSTLDGVSRFRGAKSGQDIMAMDTLRVVDYLSF